MPRSWSEQVKDSDFGTYLAANFTVNGTSRYNADVIDRIRNLTPLGGSGVDVRTASKLSFEDRDGTKITLVRTNRKARTVLALLCCACSLVSCSMTTFVSFTNVLTPSPVLRDVTVVAVASIITACVCLTATSGVKNYAYFAAFLGTFAMLLGTVEMVWDNAIYTAVTDDLHKSVAVWAMISGSMAVVMEILSWTFDTEFCHAQKPEDECVLRLEGCCNPAKAEFGCFGQPLVRNYTLMVRLMQMGSVAYVLGALCVVSLLAMNIKHIDGDRTSIVYASEDFDDAKVTHVGVFDEFNDSSTIQVRRVGSVDRQEELERNYTVRLTNAAKKDEDYEVSLHELKPITRSGMMIMQAILWSSSNAMAEMLTPNPVQVTTRIDMSSFDEATYTCVGLSLALTLTACLCGAKYASYDRWLFKQKHVGATAEQRVTLQMRQLLGTRDQTVNVRVVSVDGPEIRFTRDDGKTVEEARNLSETYNEDYSEQFGTLVKYPGVT